MALQTSLTSSLNQFEMRDVCGVRVGRVRVGRVRVGRVRVSRVTPQTPLISDWFREDFKLV